MWGLYVLGTIILWGITDIFYKKGANKDDKYRPFKFSVCIGLVFLIISIYYLVIRDEPFSIFESAVKFWPVTLFGIAYVVINTFTFQGFMYNDVSVVAPIENTASGSYVILLVLMYVAIGRVNSIWDVLTPYKVAGILCILTGLVFLGIVQNRENNSGKNKKILSLKSGACALIFPIVFSLMDGTETIITGIYLDKTFGYAMPEGDSIIILGMEYAIIAFGFWIFISLKEKHVFNPFNKQTIPLIGGALCDNVAIVLYAYAMAIDSVATDPVLAVYPVITLLLSRILLKEKLSVKKYLCIALILLGSVVIVIGQGA